MVTLHGGPVDFRPVRATAGLFSFSDLDTVNVLFLKFDVLVKTIDSLGPAGGRAGGLHSTAGQ